LRDAIEELAYNPVLSEYGGRLSKPVHGSGIRYGDSAAMPDDGLDYRKAMATSSKMI